MNDWLAWVLAALAAGGLIALGWWLLVETEGVYLGRRMVVWLYDLYADRYDDIKKFRSEYDHMFLSQPIMDAIAPHQAPLVLDVATGTGRLPLALLNHAHFQGRVIGADLSRRMLRKAALKLGGEPRVTWLWCPAERLPFPDSTFDVVTCLESLEFMEQPEAALRELVRVLRPGGLLLTTNRIRTRLMPGKTWSDVKMQSLLESFGMEDVLTEYWQVDYDRVWGRKAGDSPVSGARPLAEILRCPRCRAALLMESAAGWTCPNCGYAARVGRDGVIEVNAD